MAALYKIRMMGDGICALLAFCMTSVMLKFLVPFDRGFFCEDSSIRYPYHKDAITTTTSLVFFIGIPLIFLVICETVCYLVANDKTSIVMFTNIYNEIVTFVFGSFFSLAFVHMIKMMIGRLSPYFIDVCNPEVDCSLEENRFRYITNFTCLNEPESKEAIEQGRQSFPSTRASLATQSMAYLCIYMEEKLVLKGVYLVKRLIQISFIGVAVGVSTDRIAQNIHHWSDILGGMVIGLVFAILQFYSAQMNARNMNIIE